MDNDSKIEPSGLTEYERLRQSKIRRNFEHLKSLGLERGVIAPLHGGEDNEGSSKKKKKKKNKVVKGLPPTRVSKRVRKEKVEYDVDKAYDLLDDIDPMTIQRSAGGRKGGGVVGGGGKMEIYKEVPDVIEGDEVEGVGGGGKGGGKMNVRDVSLRTSMLRSGLNKLMNENTKYPAVMWLTGSATKPPSQVVFSKYSGIVEFKNAFLLWVNFDAKGGGYVNNWSEGGRCIKWYGGSKLKIEDEKTKRMVEMGKKKEGEGGIVMMAR
ncbi:hypothetical protein TrCOL_g862 [Triparma columacea]|nr:hypothetical protein TrCOL_g862 [Triparma columacea]